MKTEILKLLRETDGYVSGQQISRQFGVSRTAVWKVIRQLQEEGYQVEAVRNKGYHIVDSPDVMTKEELASLMNTRWAGRNILYYDVTDSTNLRIKQVGDEGAPHGTLAVADRQTAGRGRRGRTWESLRAAVYICPFFCVLRSHRIKRPCSHSSWLSAWRKEYGSAYHSPDVLNFRSSGPMMLLSMGRRWWAF